MNSEILIYQNPDGHIKIDVRLEEETVWLTQEQMAELFGKGRSTVAEHIANVYEEAELVPNRTCRKFRQVHQEGIREVEREFVKYRIAQAAVEKEQSLKEIEEDMKKLSKPLQ